MLSSRDTVLGKYRIVQVIGEGAYGRVYRAESLDDPRRSFAIKEMEETGLPAEERGDARELFNREAELLRSLSHPGLPAVMEYFSQSDCHYIVMDYVRGENLESILKKRTGAFSFNEVLPWAMELAGILDYLHGHRPWPVIFRDLKPSNIMLTEDGRIKLIDFGIARHFNPQKTKDTFFLGTPGFSPPEQYGSGQSDPRSDIFSFGATLYHLLSKADMTAFNFNYPSLSQRSNGFPDWLDRVVLKCLSKNPGERYQNVSQLLSDLQNRTFGSDNDALSQAHVAQSSRYSKAAHQSAGRPAGIWPGSYVLLIVFAILAMLIGLILSNYRALFSMGAFLSIQFFLAIAFIFIYVLRSNYRYGPWPGSTLWCNLSLVLIVLLLMGTVVYPNYLRAQEDGMLVACKSNLRRSGEAAERYAVNHSGAFPDKLEQLTPDYLKSIPSCPASRREYGYMHGTNPQAYSVFCRGSSHVPNGSTVDFPLYDNVTGLYELPPR